jgi:octopine/nopaline transport system permease protein
MTYADWIGWSKLLLYGALTTILISLVAFCIGTLVAIVIVVGRFSRNLAIRGLADAYVTIVRGVPDLLVIYLLFFGGIVAFNGLANLIREGSVLIPSPYLTGSLASGLICGAFLSEVFRSAILSLNKGHIEAAVSTGMSSFLLFRRIVMPLALRAALPGIGNIWLSTLKGSSLISVTGVTELMEQAQVGAGSTRLPFTFYSMAAILYLCISAGSMWWINALERQAQRGVRKGL